MLQNNSAARQIIVKAFRVAIGWSGSPALYSSISLHFAQSNAKLLVLVGKS